MIIFPSLIFGLLAVLMTVKGRRSLALTHWTLAIVCMLGAMSYHMDGTLSISL